MFAKSMWGHQLETQGAILDRVGELAAKGELDAGITRREVLSVASLVAGHEFQASGKSYGKIAFEMPDTLA
jgi:NADPH:quinone reductase